VASSLTAGDVVLSTRRHSARGVGRWRPGQCAGRSLTKGTGARSAPSYMPLV